MGSDSVIPVGRSSVFGESALRAISRFLAQAHASSRVDGNIAVNCATVVESYFDVAVERLIETNTALASPLPAYLLGLTHADFSRSWDSRLAVFQAASGVSVKGGKAWEAFRHVIELRNALVHGGGRLTDRQSATLLKQLTLEHDLARVLGVRFKGAIIELTRASILASVEASRTMVLEVESTLPEESILFRTTATEMI